MFLNPFLLLLTQVAGTAGAPVQAPAPAAGTTVTSAPAQASSAKATSPLGAAAKAGAAAPVAPVTPGPTPGAPASASAAPAAGSTAPAPGSGTPAPASATPAPEPPGPPEFQTLYLVPGDDKALPTSKAKAALPAPERLYSMTISNKEADDSLIRLCNAAGIPVEFLSPATDMVTLSFTKVTLFKALDLICTAAGLRFLHHDGVIAIGLTMDLDVQYPTPGQGNLDAVYSCRHLDADALCQTLGKVLPPTVKITSGPKFKSPTVDSGNDPSGVSGGDSMRGLAVTDNTFRINDILLSGPADSVRRGIMLARKFDRPRKQVRIDIRITEIDDNLVQNLGVSWMNGQNGTLAMSATEQIPASAAGATIPTLVPGLRMGSFSHTPLQVNASLNALEQKGKSRTLSNPSILLLDGERSFILSGKKLLYPKYTGKDQGGQSIYDVAELKVGIYLQVAVQIGLNNDVIMSLMPQVTSTENFQTYNGGEYPIVDSREAQTTVHAYSGEMVALGGLRTTLDSEEKDGIPFLKDLPFFGRLFSNVNKNKTKSDLVIFLTPRIYDDLDHVESIPVTVTQAETGA